MKEDEKLETADGPIAIDPIDPYKLQNMALHHEIAELKKKLEDALATADHDAVGAKKGCPFCGEKPWEVLGDIWNGETEGYAVFCNKRGCRAMGPVKRNTKLAVKGWDHRTKSR